MKMKLIILTVFFTAMSTWDALQAQNIFSGERVQIVGAFNGYTVTPYGTDYRTTAYRRLSVASGTPTDGRGQWTTTINVQSAGGDVTPINMPGGGGNGLLFISGPAANRFQNKWVFSGVGQATVDGINNISCFNCGNDMGLNMSTPGYYTFVFNDAGYTATNTVFYTAYTSAAPAGITRNGETLNTDGTATVSITTGATPSAQEKIFVRYTTGTDFSGSGISSIVQATGSGTSYSATIPAQAGGSVVRYYVFSSTRTLAQLTADTERSRSLAGIRYDDNSGANYVYTPSVLPVKITAFRAGKNNNGVLVSWAAESEQDMDRYELLRSADAVNFVKVYETPAKNSAASQWYSWNDAVIPGPSVYYKLASVDRDSKRSYSAIIRVNGESGGRLELYPNPIINKGVVWLPVIPQGVYRLQVINMAGQVIWQQQVAPGNSTRTLPLILPENTAKGKYTLVLQGARAYYSMPFSVQ
jgi:hypothetical protein